MSEGCGRDFWALTRCGVSSRLCEECAKKRVAELRAASKAAALERARSVIERNEPQFAPPASPSLREQRRVLLDYLKTKTALEDWHAVWDAAVDLKVLDEQIRLTEAR